jgi:uncharacterized membrane protein
VLTLCNNHSELIVIAISFWEPEECGAEGNGWHNIGWYWVEPGTCRVVYRNDVDDAGRFWYFFAEARDGTTWSGDFPGNVKNDAFDHCDTPADTSMIAVDFFEIDVGDAEDFTLTFVP